MVVRFPDDTTRDAVRSSAFNLAGSNPGMRLEILDNLRPSLRALSRCLITLKRYIPD